MFCCNKWTTADMPSLDDKIAIVTGGNIGLGYKTSLELARKGATVVIACRSEEKGNIAKARIEKEVPYADIDIIPLDLTDQDSVANFAETYLGKYDYLDILVNNAGVVNLAELTRTQDGKEMHMATNHYGHYALTSQLLPAIKRTDGARVVTVSSGSYKFGEIRFDDLDWHKREYSRGKCYGDSKLANMLFMLKLQRLFDENGVNAISVGAHPGLTGTERQQSIGMRGKLAKFMASDVSVGCLPQLRASTDPSVRGGEYYGPKVFIRGKPVSQKITGDALDIGLQDKFWDHSQSETGCQF